MNADTKQDWSFMIRFKTVLTSFACWIALVQLGACQNPLRDQTDQNQQPDFQTELRQTPTSEPEEQRSPKSQEDGKAKGKRKLFKTAEQVIDNYVLKLGGYELLDSRQSIHYTCRARRGSDEFNYEVFMTSGQYYTSYRYDNGRHFERGMKNGVAWSSTNGSARRITGEELRGFVSRHKHITSVTRWTEKSQSLQLVGIESVNGKQAYRVEFVDEDGFKKTRFFDLKSGMMVKSIAEEVYVDQTRTVTRYYSDFIQLGDALIPRVRKVISRRSSGTTEYVFEIQDYEVDCKIPKGTFDLPRVIQQEVRMARLNKKIEAVIEKPNK
jgi:hypothetical protein